MKFLSASEDLEGKTLEAIRTLVQRLQYLASLRDEQGNYVHWGMARVHGETSAERAIAEAHAKVFIELLRSPLQDLAGQLHHLNAEEIEAVNYFRRLLEASNELLPNELSGGSLLHLNSVLVALEELCQARRATHPGA